MDISAIGAASITMSQSRLMQSVDVAMMRKVMDSQKTQAAALIEDLQQAVPEPGHQLNILA